MQSSQKGCEICGNFNKLFNEQDIKHSLSREKATEKRCSVHTPLLDWVENKYAERNQLEREAGYKSRNYEASGFYLAQKNGDIPSVAVTDYRGRPQGPVIDPNWINFGIARSWMNKCITEHKSECQSPLNLQTVSPAWLIDTKDDCLIPGTTSNEYIALSYRWGPSPAPQMDTDTFNQMSVPGGLSKQKAFLTPTVRHAIHTVRELGERYLWVDAICLPPDDIEQVSQQLQLMGSIYASAKLTIVALDGDANTGFQGLKGESLPRKLPNLFPWKSDTNLLLRNQPKLSAMDVQASEYFTRGWTYQEYMLSQRRLIFGNQQIHWKCSCADWHEDLPTLQEEQKGKSVRPRSLGFPNIKRGLSDIREFGILINEYSARELKYPEDAYPAADGLLNYLGKLAFPGGFLFGLPKVYFGMALMWSVEFGMANPNRPQRPGLVRRKPSERSHSILPNTHLPSWSWVGWSGYGVHMLDREAQFRWADLLLSENGWNPVQLIRTSSITMPITEWFSHSSKNWNVTQALQNHATIYDKNSDISYDKRVWTRKEFDPAKHGSKAKDFNPPFGFSGKNVFEHVNLPGKYFWWPLPPSSSSRHDVEESLSQSPLISCRAKRAWFGATQVVRYIRDVNMDAHLRLLDKNNRLCGWLQLPNNDELAKFPESMIREGMANHSDTLSLNGVFLNPSPNRDESLELVAICRCKFADIETMDDEIQYKEFYGVLWVDWNDGIAHRKGCGYVKKELWEEQDLEDVNLILG
ncbi:heterokaryon incompatibility protein-domain-containing protein [Fusarium venenatum]|uniref:heterokaryon incompatibility protein-domain-containing protein n=1 Tax=Fusarium venenatum TaxID=56646 RepID=UPI001E06D50A|nr:heterokaryon incompatibility protein-domain-containing protein [Fusarium venenatum]